MYDYLSIEIDNIPPEIFLNNSRLKFTSNKDENNQPTPNEGGNYIKTAQLSESLQLVHEYRPRTNRNIFKIKGSFHKHAQTDTNYCNYTLNDFERTIKELSELLTVDVFSFHVRCFEYGVNVSPCHYANDVLNSIICYSDTEYEKRTYNGNGYLKRFVFKQYEIKVYNKGKQYGLTANILRYEVKVKKMDFVNRKLSTPINTIRDLLNPQIVCSLNEILLYTIDKLYVSDYRINTKEIKCNRDKHTLIECSNPAFWGQYRKTHSTTGYKKKVKRFRELVRRYAPDDLQTDFKKLVSNQLRDLQTVTHYDQYTKNRTVTHYDPYIVGNNSILYPRFCFTCGRDISRQKKGSKFCSEKLNGKEVKKCRNTVSNFELRERRRYNGPTLFEINQYLNPEFRRLKGGFNG